MAALTGGAALATSARPADLQARPATVLSASSRPVGAARLVVLGDSVASGAGCDCDPFGQLVATSLASGDGRAVTLTNAARDGLTTQGLVDQLQEHDLGPALGSATLVTVTIGANDFDPDLVGHPDCLDLSAPSCYRDRLASFGVDLRDILTRLHALAPAARVLITGYWNVFLDGDVGGEQGETYVHVSDALTRTVNAQIAQQASASRATYIDLYGPFAQRPLRELTALLAPDGDHPSATGHRLIASILLRASQ